MDPRKAKKLRSEGARSTGKGVRNVVSSCRHSLVIGNADLYSTLQDIEEESGKGGYGYRCHEEGDHAPEKEEGPHECGARGEEAERRQSGATVATSSLRSPHHLFRPMASR